MTMTERKTQPTDFNVDELVAWLDALRSGSYQQGTDYLKKRLTGEDGWHHCCLGVAGEVCDLTSWQTQPDNVMVEELVFPCFDDHNYDSSIELPMGMHERLGLRSVIGGIPKDIQDDLRELLDEHGANPGELPSDASLVHLNDAGVPFSVIADVIEAGLPLTIEAKRALEVYRAEHA